MTETAGNAGIPEWELHHRLDRALEFAGLKPSDMAEHLELAETTVRNYLSARTRPNGGVLRSWAMRCGVPFAWLKYGDDYDDDGPHGGGEQDTSRLAWNGERNVVPFRVLQEAA